MKNPLGPAKPIARRGWGSLGPGSRYREWLMASVITGSAQIGAQLLAFVSGLLVLRLLPPDQYAYYTIATAVSGSMVVLADCGLTNAVLTQGGAHWQDRAALGTIINTGLALRVRLGCIVAALCAPLLIFLLMRQGCGLWEALALTLALQPAFFLGMNYQVMEVAPRLHQRILPLQRLQLLANAARAALTSGSILALPYAFIASLAAALPQFWVNRRLRRLTNEHANPQSAPDPQVRARMLEQVKRSAPGSIYYALSGQISVWLVSVFGTTASVATVGALGRLAVAFSALALVFNTLAVSRFARIPASEPQRILARFWQSQALLALACAGPLATLWMFPRTVLSILGPHYADYPDEALLMGISGAVGIMNAAAYGLGAARGLITPPALTIPLSIAVQVALISLLRVDTVNGVIWLGLLTTTSILLLTNAYLFEKLRRQAKRLQT